MSDDDRGWKGDAQRLPIVVLVALLAPFGIVLMAGALAATVTSDIDTAILGWGALAFGLALLVYLPGRYLFRRAGRPRQATLTTGAGEAEPGGPSQWEVSPSE